MSRQKRSFHLYCFLYWRNASLLCRLLKVDMLLITLLKVHKVGFQGTLWTRILKPDILDLVQGMTSCLRFASFHDFVSLIFFIIL